MRSRSLPSALTAACVALVLVLGACGGDNPDPALAPDPETPTSQTADEDAVGDDRDEQGSDRLVASVTDPWVTVHEQPHSTAPVRTTLEDRTEFGSTTTVLVSEESGDWLHVALPTRPNGSTGWVHRSGVELSSVGHRIEIDLAGRTLTLFDEGRQVLETPVGVGAPDAPTPTGDWYVTDLLATPDPSGGYGPYAFGLSAHSDTFTEFAGGDGQIGIHGTDDPSSIGEAVSHGCVRVPNDVVRELASMLPLGTPVRVR